MKFLLIQLRKNPEALAPERENFISHSGLTPDELISLDVYRNFRFDSTMITGFQGFFVGGLSDDPSDKTEINEKLYPFLKSFNNLLAIAEEKKIPGLLSCGGFMLASKLWGAEIKISKERKEMGVYDLFLLEEGKNDILLKDLPGYFKIVSGHLKSTMYTPPKCILMGSSEKCSIHILRLRNAPVYAFQGHPEITTNDLKDRVSPYKEKYFENDLDYHRFLNLTADTGPVNSLVKRFVQLIRECRFHEEYKG